MALSTAQREQVWRGLMRYWSSQEEPIGDVTKQELLTAVGDVDDWIESSQANFNASLSNPFKSEATAEQKTLVFVAVAAMRQGPAFARTILGELD